MTKDRAPVALHLSLPWPPSVNHYWGRRAGQRRDYIKEKGKLFRWQVWYKAREARKAAKLATRGDPVFGSWFVAVIDAHPPDFRTRDPDNIEKALWDALKKCDVIADDKYQRLVIRRWHEPRPKAGRVLVALLDVDHPRVKDYCPLCGSITGPGDR